MLFEDQIEQLKEYSESLGARIQESSLYIKAHERFSALSPLFQKILILCLVFFLLFLVLAAPITNYQTSIENLKSFEERKELTQKLLTYAQSSANQTASPKKYSLPHFQSEVDRLGQSYSIKLLSDQSQVSTSPVEKKKVLGAEQSNFVVKNKKVNIEQIAALAYSLKRANKSFVLTSLEIDANKEDSRYFDTKLEVANLYVEPLSSILPQEQSVPINKQERNRRR